MYFNVLLPVFALIFLLIIRFFAGREFYKAATAKGWNQRKFFWFPFLLGIPGYLLVIALPDRGGQHMSALVSDDLPDL